MSAAADWNRFEPEEKFTRMRRRFAAVSPNLVPSVFWVVLKTQKTLGRG